MADTSLSIGVVAELSAFKRSLSEIPGIGAQEARDLAAGIRRELRSAESAATSAARGTSTAWKSELQAIEIAAKKSFERIGGTLGPVGSGLIDLTKALGGVGVAAGVLGAAGGGLALVGLGLDRIMDSAVAADDRLTRLGITTAQHASIREYAAATTDLQIAFDELTVAVGGELAEDLTSLVHAAVSGVQAFGDLRAGLTLLQRAVTAVGSLGLSELAISTIDAAAATAELRVGVDGLTDAQRLEAEAAQDTVEGARQQAHARTAEAEATRAATAAATAAAAAAKADQVKIEQVWAARIEWYQALADAADRTAATEQAASAATRSQLIADNQAVLDETSSILDARIAASEAYEQAQVGSDQRLAASVVGYVDQVADSYARLLDVVVSNFEARMAAGEDFTHQEEALFKTAITARKVLSVAQAFVDSAVVFSGTTANLAAALGPYAPLAGGAIATAVLGASLAAIASESAVQYQAPNPFGTSSAGVAASGSGNNAPGAIEGTGGAVKGENSVQDSFRSTGGGLSLTLDPRLRRLQVVESARTGKRVRGAP